ncbi:hypothetical protein [Clostridium beijerinckii]|uniref:hypothetical protein n=1 Tax=Clostridium beijerinckii TaxID=1520 RepID=UPI0009D4ABEB|nr:hypothetical protein [Clostridium beijerinckii]NRT76288.1 hypothetical protein [Clostridium beijerinckii]OOM48674.1 hypothetical protein CBEIJ_21460 [Clostridium beijerinckii]
MQTSSNYGLKLFEGTDNVKRQDFVDNFTKIDSVMKEHDTHLSDMVYQTAGGSTTAITIAIKGTLVNGYPITFIASANNGGAATTINGKKLYKPGTISSPNLIAGKAYTVWYNSTGDCFFIKASAEGDADVSHVLATKKFSNDNDTGLVGTMPNNGAIIQSLSINGSYTIPKGYHDGTGKVTQSIPTKAGTTINPSTSQQVIPAGQYLSGDQIIKGDLNLTPDNILLNKSIFGVIGSVKGLKTANGSLNFDVSTTRGINFTLPTQSFTVVAWIVYEPNIYSYWGSSNLNLSTYYLSNGAGNIGQTTFRTSNIPMYCNNGTMYWVAIGY